MICSMDESARENGHLTAKEYFAMSECGIFSPDERIELLDGLIVAMTPQSPWHASTVSQVHSVLQRNLGPQRYIRIQSSFRLDDRCVPEPDLAIVPGSFEDYRNDHPTRAHLIVEVAIASLIQDRITKAAIYARAGIPSYWLINLREMCVEVFRKPNPGKGEYTSVERCVGAEVCRIDAFPDVNIEAKDLLPPPGSLPKE
jgi:Uma2 family endonuclease